MMLIPVVKEIFADTTAGKAWTNRNLWLIRSTGVDDSIPIFTQIHSGMRKSSTPATSDITRTIGTRTRIPIGTTAPRCGLNASSKIYNIQKSATIDLRKYNKFDTWVDVKFTNNLVTPPIFTEVLCDKLSDSSIRDVYTRFQVNLAVDTINIPAPQFVYLEISTIGLLDKGTSLWTPATRVGRHTDVAHWSVLDHIFGKTTVVRDAVSAKSDYDYETDFEIWREKQKFEHQKSFTCRPR